MQALVAVLALLLLLAAVDCFRLRAALKLMHKLNVKMAHEVARLALEAERAKVSEELLRVRYLRKVVEDGKPTLSGSERFPLR